MIRPFGAQDDYCTMVNAMRAQVVKVGDVVEGATGDGPVFALKSGGSTTVAEPETVAYPYTIN